jgi:eukaryotic-like serine/threonine-protein kinase
MSGDTPDELGDTEAGAANSSPAANPATGYQIERQLGRGGMGEVMLATDPEIGREIAIKRMLRAEEPAARARFIREAKIQARLGHPAIVPVHEIGADANGRPYFTMKRLTGKTMQEVLRDPGVRQQRLLRALVDVCRAIELAHASGVIHRDLKPGNIMLGEYGEVYVIDWGVARVVGSADESTDAGLPAEAETAAGTMLGTLGYMAPEQMEDSTTVGPAADVYALGCVLYEILTGVRAHPPGADAMTSTMLDMVRPPTTRTPDRNIPLELEELCMGALAFRPGDRPTARTLADRLEDYLDGDRDLERRRAVAAGHLTAARTALADPARRAEAAHEAGRALALDPTSPEAGELVQQLMFEIPPTLPPELTSRLGDLDHEMSRESARAALGVLVPMSITVPLLGVGGVASWPWLVGLIAALAVMGVVAYQQSRTGKTDDYMALVGMMAITVLMTRVGGLFVLTPMVVCVALMGLGQQAPFIRRPVFLVMAPIATLAIPFVLERVGVFETSQDVEAGKLVVTSTILELNWRTLTMLLVVHVVMAIAAALFGRALGASRRRALVDSEIQRWHLQQLIGVAR